MNKVAMIPVRLGSQRLKKKNLKIFSDITLIEYAIKRCIESNVFDQIFVNSDSLLFKKYTLKYNIQFYQRPRKLGNNTSTSEEFVEDFLKNNKCKYLYQIHTITPLFSSRDIRNFYKFCSKNLQYNTVLSCVNDQIEVAYNNQPVNFCFKRKTNSQDLLPVQRITWAATKWTSQTFLNAKSSGKSGTYSGKVGFFAVRPYSGIAIKTSEDLKITKAIKKIL